MSSKAKRQRVVKSEKGDGSDGMAEFVCNPHLKGMEEDVLYHLALDNKKYNLKEMFSDVKFVCLGGSPNRMKQLAEFLIQNLPYRMETGHTLCNIAGGSDRYVLYKVGSVLCASHGMGVPSLSIILHELFKLLHHAECKDVTVFRIGTSGGIGLKPGSVVISESCLNGLLQPYMNVPILGKLVQFPADMDEELITELLACSKDTDEFKTIRGKTLCTDDFYEGQGRLDGAFCSFTKEEKMSFLQELVKKGVRNIEMEAVCFAAMCKRAKVKGAIICATLLDRLKGDQVNTPHDVMAEWTVRPQTILLRYIKGKLNLPE